MITYINDQPFDIPFSLGVIPLGKFVDYNIKFGKALDAELKEIVDKKFTPDPYMNDEENKIDAEDQRLHLLDNHIDKEALSWYSYWSGFDFFQLLDQPNIKSILDQYRQLRVCLRNDADIPKEFPAEINWNGEVWVIQDYKVNATSKMTYNEVITSKEVGRMIRKMNGGKWEVLPYLCAIFLRKKDEKFIDELLQPSSGRLQLFNDLPLKYGIAVSFFLNICVNILSNILPYSAEKELAR